MTQDPNKTNTLEDSPRLVSKNDHLTPRREPHQNDFTNNGKSSANEVNPSEDQRKTYPRSPKPGHINGPEQAQGFKLRVTTRELQDVQEPLRETEKETEISVGQEGQPVEKQICEQIDEKQMFAETEAEYADKAQ